MIVCLSCIANVGAERGEGRLRAQPRPVHFLVRVFAEILLRSQGDMSNAIYWDRRAGTNFAQPYPYAEWALYAEEAVSG